MVSDPEVVWDYLCGLWRSWFPRKEVVVVGGEAFMPPPPPVPDILRRFPKYPLGCRLRNADGKVGLVDSIYADYRAALNSNIIGFGWLEAQGKKPTSTDQIFYSLIMIEKGPDGAEFISGAILAGENDVELVEGQA